LPVFSLAIGTFGYAKPIANIANQLTALAILAMAKPIANIANQPRHQARVARHGLSWQLDQSIVLFARSFLLLAFCWRSPPQGRRPGRSEPVGPQEIFLFLIAQQPNSPTAQQPTKLRNFFY
jgi:hypothetical protein